MALTVGALASSLGAVELPLVPRLGLTAHSGGTSVDLPAGDPLMLFVALSNPLGSEIPRLNAERAADQVRYEQSETFRAMSADEQGRVREHYRPLEVPRFTLGSQGRPVSSLVRFEIRDFQGRLVEVPVRLLAVSATVESSRELTDADATILKFGVDAAATQALEPGIYSVVAAIDTREETGMWQGRVVTEPVTLHLMPPPEVQTRQAANRRQFLIGRYLLADGRYDEAWAHASAMTKADPVYIGGWQVLGEALDGRGEPAEAIEALEQARSLHEEMLFVEQPTVPEAPEALARRIEEISAKLTAGS